MKGPCEHSTEPRCTAREEWDDGWAPGGQSRARILLYVSSHVSFPLNFLELVSQVLCLVSVSSTQPGPWKTDPVGTAENKWDKHINLRLMGSSPVTLTSEGHCHRACSSPRGLMKRTLASSEVGTRCCFLDMNVGRCLPRAGAPSPSLSFMTKWCLFAVYWKYTMVDLKRKGGKKTKPIFSCTKWRFRFCKMMSPVLGQLGWHFWAPRKTFPRWAQDLSGPRIGLNEGWCYLHAAKCVPFFLARAL